MWLFLADHSVSYADRVEARLVERAESLGRMPQQGRRIPYSDARRLSVPDVQHVISHRIEDDAVRILDLRSTRQQPEQP